MSKDTIVRSRVDSGLKADAETILHGQGITMSQAINLMLRQVVIQNKLPFDMAGAPKLNARAQALCDAYDAGEIPTTEYPDSKAFFASLGIS